MTISAGYLTNQLNKLNTTEKLIHKNIRIHNPNIQKIVIAALSQISNILNTIERKKFNFDIETFLINDLYLVINRIKDLSLRQGLTTRKKRAHLNKKLRSFYRIYHKLKSPSVNTEILYQRLQQLPSYLPAINLFYYNKWASNWNFLSNINLKILLNLKSDETLDRLFFNTHLVTVSDLKELLQENLSSSKNILEILKSHFDTHRKKCRDLMSEEDRQSFDTQWKDARIPLEAQDYLHNLTIEKELENENDFLKRIVMYVSSTNVTLLLLKLKNSEEASWFNCDLQLNIWHCLWSQDGVTFYYQPTEHHLIFYFFYPYLYAVVDTNNRAYYNRIDVESLRGWQQKMLMKQISIQSNGAPNLRIFHKIATLQELIIRKLLSKSETCLTSMNY